MPAFNAAAMPEFSDEPFNEAALLRQPAEDPGRILGAAVVDDDDRINLGQQGRGVGQHTVGRG